MRLYLRIYLAVLGSLLVFALLAGAASVAFRSFDEDDRRSFFAMGRDIAERLLATERGPEALRVELEFWNRITGFSIALLTPQGDMLAQAGDFPPAIARDLRRGRFGPPWRRKRLYWMGLKDGRRLVALRPEGSFHWLRHWRWLAALLAIALAVGVAAYPIVRHLTRRLERLQQGVAAFGGGDLSARVNVSGRDEIAGLAETFNASAARIEQLLNAHKALLANASHELRSPLSRLRMAVESLGAEGQPATREEIARNIAELDALVEEILLASRLQADASQGMTLESVDLVGLLAEECAPYGADLSVTAGAVPTLHGDARLLRRLFRNLLENAARYGGAEPPTVTVSQQGGQAQADVCDRGPGVPEAERERIFEPFHRLRNVPESAGGAGLGLALVRQIAERHGGGVRCLPREGGGACFRVTLPVNRLANAAKPFAR
jgi:signal transduction histidine kinase